MAECQVKPMNLLERLQNLLERKPKTYDVTFCVGPEKKLVRGLKVILKAASPVFEREFEGNWEVGIVKSSEGIPLPDFDGKAFELFIKLTTLDTWSLTTLEDLNLSPNQMLNLMKICRHFEVIEGLKNLTAVSASFFRSFNEYKKSDDALQLSRENLQNILRFDDIPLEEFDLSQAACRSLLEFKTEPRLNYKPSLTDYKRLCLKKEFKVVENTPFDCNGTNNYHAIVANKKIEINGLGFFGPINKDAEYDATFRLWRCNNYFHRMSKRISAEKGKVFYWIFDNPVVLEPGELKWGKEYGIHFSLQGPPTSSVQREYGTDYLLQDGRTEFLICLYSNQLAEILYTTM